MASRSFSLFEMDSLIRSAGAERVAEGASVKLAELLEDDAKRILGKAKVFAKHAKRKSITRKDILLACKH